MKCPYKYKIIILAVLISFIFSLLPLPHSTPRAYASAADSARAVCLGWGQVAKTGAPSTEGGTSELARQATAVPVQVNPYLTGSLSEITGQTTTETCMDFAEWVFNILIETLKKQILDMIVNQIVDWISGGGRPKFVTDWGGLLDNAVNVAVGRTIEEIGAGFLCEPFNLQVRLSLLPVQTFGEQITCTLDEVVANIQNFYDDFRNGGWLAYSATVQPQNNIYGALYLSWDRELANIARDVEAAENEAISSGGFLSQKECEEEYGPWPAGGAPPDLDGDGAEGDDPNRCTIITPGDAVGALASKAIAADIEYLIEADDLEAYISAIVNALINRVITEGVGLLGAGSVPPQPPSPPNVCAGLTGPALTACLNYVNGAGAVSFQIARQNLIVQIDALLNPRGEAQAFITNSIQRLQNYLTNLSNFLGPCVNLTTQIGGEVAWAQNTLNNLLPQSATNSNIINQLTGAEAALEGLADNDFQGLSNIQNQVQQFLDLNAATSLRNQATQENQTIINRVNTTLQNMSANCSPGPAPAIIPPPSQS